VAQREDVEDALLAFIWVAEKEIRTRLVNLTNEQQTKTLPIPSHELLVGPE